MLEDVCELMILQVM